jgi:glutamate racemase
MLNSDKFMKIGFFDSGLGGLIILKAVTKAVPEYDYVYYGDTKNLPYGDKTEAEIFALTEAGVGELFLRDCALVIIACNTASAETLRKLQDNYLVKNFPERRILGVIIPTVETIIDTKETEVLLLATKRTVDSGKYDIELKNRVGDQVSLLSVATPELVPLIEGHKVNEAVLASTQAIKKQLTLNPNIRVVVLGCTHYTLLKVELKNIFPELIFISQDEVIPEKLKSYLRAHPEIRNTLSLGQTRNIILTEHRPDYDEVAQEFLNGVFINDN